MKVSGCVCLLALLCVLGCTRSTAPPKDLSTVRLRVRVGGRTGYIDGTGKLVINPQFGSASEFSEGLAVVCVGDCDFGREGQGSHKYGFINESGKIVINPQFDQVREFAEGLAAFCFGSGCQLTTGEAKWGFMDKSGHFVIGPQYGEVGSFTEGLALACIGNCSSESGKWGFIDRTGRFAINPQYDYAAPFKDGFALVEVGDVKDRKAGYIDKSGKMIWTPSN